MPSMIRNKNKEHADPKVEKKPYEKPTILYRAPLEAMAAACATGSNQKQAEQLGCTIVVNFS